jgi:hypothetical protein
MAALRRHLRRNPTGGTQKQRGPLRHLPTPQRLQTRSHLSGRCYFYPEFVISPRAANSIQDVLTVWVVISAALRSVLQRVESKCSQAVRNETRPRGHVFPVFLCCSAISMPEASAGFHPRENKIRKKASHVWILKLPTADHSTRFQSRSDLLRVCRAIGAEARRDPPGSEEDAVQSSLPCWHVLVVVERRRLRHVIEGEEGKCDRGVRMAGLRTACLA